MKTRIIAVFLSALIIMLLTMSNLPTHSFASSVGGGAHGGTVTGSVSLIGVPTNVNTPPIAPVTLPPTGGTFTNQQQNANSGSLGVNLYQSGVVTNTTTGTVGSGSAHAESTSTVNDVNIFGGVVTANEIISRSTSDSNGQTATSSATGTTSEGLVVGGNAVPDQSAPNTVIPITNLPLNVGGIGLMTVNGTVTINEQIAGGDGVTTSSLTVNYLHVELVAEAVIGVARVEANYIIASASTSAASDAVVANQCPSVSVTGGTTKTIQAGQTLSFQVSATDPDGNAVTLTATNIPANASFTPNPATGTPTANGTFSFTPAAGQANQTFNVSFTATDNNGCSSGTATPTVVQITVTPPPNNCPSITVAGGTNKTVQVGQTLSFQVSATDSDGNTVTLTATNIPANASFSPNPASGTPTANGTFNFTPAIGQANQSFTVNFTATDNNGCSSGSAIPVPVQITVTSGPPPNQCPAVSVTGGTTRTVQAGQALSFQVSATDADGNTVTLTASNLPSGSTFTPNPATGTPTASGTFNFTPSAGQAGQTFNVSFTATDNNGCSSATATPIVAQITVTSPPNNCPSITVAGGTNRAVQVGQTLSFQVSATDPDGNAVTLTASNLPSGSSFAPNPSTGTPTATGTFNFTPSAGQANQSFTVNFKATDNNGCGSDSALAVPVQITVTSGPPPNQCPIINVAGGATHTVEVGQPISFQVSATDPDGNAVTLTASNLPSGSNFNPNPATGTPTATGTFTFTSTPQQAGQSFAVSFKATDNNGCTNNTATPVSVLILVGTGGDNNCPVVTVAGGTSRSVQIGETISFQVTATDPESDVVTLVASNLPPNASFTPNPATGTPSATGTFSFTPSSSQASQTFNVSFTASDNKGCSGGVPVPVTTSITVGSFGGGGGTQSPCGNHAPVISVPSLPVVGVGEKLEFRVKAVDEDNDQLTINVDHLPDNAEFNPSTGLLTFTPDEDQLRGEQLGQGVLVIFSATDSKGATTRAAVDITVVASTTNPRPPALSLPPGPILVKVADRLSFAVAGQAQISGCSVTLSASGLPPSAAFDTATNMFSFTPDASMISNSFTVNFTATDCGGHKMVSALQLIVVDSDQNCTPRGAGIISVPLDKLFFKAARVGTGNGATSISITNPGGGLLMINSVTLSDSTNYRIEGISELPLTLQPGGVIELRVCFEPKSKGKKAATLTIFSSDADTPALDIVLSGKGLK